MRSRKRTGVVLVALFAALAISGTVSAEDVEKRFRIGLAIGGFNGQDEIDSDAANVLTIVDELLFIEDRFVDPRNDSAVFGKLDIQQSMVSTLSAQYAVTKMLIIEASVGYQKTDVGDIEMQAQFSGIDIPETESFQFSVYRVPAGELERVPIQLSAFARFRPRASFNPYVGGGIGYTIIGFDPSEQFNALSRNLDASRGGFAVLSSALFGTATLTPPGIDGITDLTGASIDAQDTFEWHFAGGAELNFKRKWAVFADIRYSFSSRSLSIGFDGQEDLGVAVPQLTDFENSAAASAVYGAVAITTGGLIDGGSLVPELGANPNTNCVSDPEDCVFERGTLDGELDTGFYYIQGGTVDYGGLSVQAGVRYTF